MPKVLAICVGEVHLRIGVADTKTKEMKIISEALTSKTSSALLKQIFSVVDGLKGYEGIGIVFPGLVHASEGIVHESRNLGIEDLEIVDILEKRYKVPVFLSNLSLACVLGEKLFGAGKKYKDIVYLVLSAGIECGVILDGTVLIGKDGNAHEIGHTVIDANSEVLCGCGKRGHWEAFCSESGIPVFAKYLLENKYVGKPSALRSVKNLDFHKVFQLAKKDRVAREIVGEINRLNTIGIANIIEIYDPQLIAIGGSLAIADGNNMIGPILRGINKYTARLNRTPKIIVTPLRRKAVLYGAVADFL